MSALARVADVLFPPITHVAMGPTPDVLGASDDPAINLAVWQRRLARALTAAAGEVLRRGTGEIRLSVAAEQAAVALAEALVAAGWPPVPVLVADVAELAQHAAARMKSPLVDLRLEIITGDACRKFHADYVGLRLITSYAGPGSQWLSNADAAALADGVALERLELRQLLAGEVALFKGKLLTDSPIIHRSPPIAGSGQRRLVLVINPAQMDCC
ncbi:hypothetical protein CHU93_16995 [Sandarakinorhabdus cyanobacteriorum]|uniref:DUF1826 domain-containing protein n=1 Tax=Sandarakinorhabdus cyanobacteriorum TaxID=1981098 RepID=A0A255Y360_9SPHN|nr:DUF1826 domain-containing protein [Sandarakinorhabdus cyanobacteriorum]OYQ23672.1 hypothetical protein CHU93_16995 [Sandarakinorhabdus cyanobacteriorum]